MSFTVDPADILQLEDRLEIKVEQRAKGYHGVEDPTVQPPLYFSTCLNEFSRCYSTFNIALTSPAMQEVVDTAYNASHLRFPEVDESNDVEETLTEDKPSSHQRILHAYRPDYKGIPSNFRKTPLENRHLLTDVGSTDLNLLVRIGPGNKVSQSNRAVFEPIFGSVTLYCLMKRQNDEELHRISETFHFDATPAPLRNTFRSVYNMDDPNFGIDPPTNISSCLFKIPNILRNNSFFLVIQLSKVLTNEPEKAIIPYTSGEKSTLSLTKATAAYTSRIEEYCKRLAPFRQSLGVKIVKVSLDDTETKSPTGPNYVQMCVMRQSFSDATLRQHILDLFPSDGSTPQSRLEPLDLDVNFSYFNLGAGEIKLPPGLAAPNGASLLHVVPSQFLSNAAASDSSWIQRLGADAETLAVRSMMPLMPKHLTLMDDVSRTAKACLDHTMFLYPVQFENFSKKSRNLSLQIQLVEFSGDITTNPTLLSQNKYKVLSNIYNTMPGRMFTSSAYTKVSYHNHMPELNDEIKLRLPLVVTKQHYILFTMHHVHVAKKDTRTSIGFFFNKADEDREAVTSLQCFGVLPLLQDDICLARDGVHRIEMCYGLDMDTFIDEDEAKHMSDRTTSSDRSTVMTAPSLSHSKSTQRRTSLTKDKMPAVKIVTRAFSTLLSTDRHVQHFLLNQPSRLGYYPTEMQSESPFYVEPLNAPAVNESILLDATRYFFDMSDANTYREEDGTVTVTSASRSEVGTPLVDEKKNYQGVMVEISRHFLVILRQLFRMMCGGIGKFSFDYANPFSHPILRCTAFISLVRVMGIVEPQSYEEVTESILQAYVEHLFDEEVFYHSMMNRNTAKVSSRRRKSNARQELNSTVGNDEDALLEHVVSQLEEVVYRGEILKAIKNAIVLTRTESIIETVEKSKAPVIDTHKPWYPTSASEDESDVTVGERWWSGCIQKEDLLAQVTSAITSEDSVTMNEKKETDLNPLIEPVVVEPLLPKYHKLDGYKLRKLRLMEAVSDMNSEEKEYPPLKWWPWLYEIIAYQWTSLLAALDDETVSAKDIILEEEEEEGEEESASSYPYNKDNTAFTFVGDSVYLKDLRGVLMDHGPVLLSLILKSLALRIKHEDKQTLVVLDEEMLVVFENLIFQLLREINCKKNSLLPPRKLNLAIANFIRQLFGIVVPIQVARLLTYYLIQSRKLQKQTYAQLQKVPMEQVKNRLNFLHHISASDYFVTLNFPLQLDSALSDYHSVPILNTHDLINTHNSSIRGVKHPPSHWLCHFIIHEIMADYQIVEKHLQDYAMSILSDLVIRNSYDKKHQVHQMRHRVASMYLPLMKMVTQDAERLESLPTDAVDRREELIIIGYLLQDVPEYLLREEFRQMTTRKLKDHILPIERFLLLLHLIIDTFELPLTKGAEEGDVRKVLCPTITCEGIADDSGTMTSKLTLSRAQLTSKSTNEALSALEALHNKKLNKFKKREKPTNAHSWKATSKTQSQTLKKTLRNVHPTILLHASKLVNFEAMSCVVKALTMVIEECPGILQDFKSIYYDTVLQSEVLQIMTNVLEVVLHGLYSNISDVSVCDLLRLTRKYIKTFGFGIFLQAVGDSLQDWMRVLLKYCNADYASVRHASCDCFVQLLHYCYEANGSIAAIRVPVLAVFSDVFFATVNRCTDEDHVMSGNYILPTRLAFKHILHIAAKYDQPAFTALVSEFVSCCNDVLSAHHTLHVKKVALVAFSWDGVERSPEYRARSPSSAASADADHLLELVYRAATIYQSTPLIRSSLFWLENLAKLHDDFNNVSESATVHWRIYEVISAALSQWSAQWCPRKPLVWGATAENKTFVKALHAALAAQAARPWPTSDTAEKQMLLALTAAAEKFSLVQLVFLAERAYHRLLDVYRFSDHTEHMSAVYEKLHKLYKDTSAGSISFAMGSFYRVLYVGQGVPESLRGKEYIYRNANHLHVSEFQALIKAHLEDYVAADTTVTVLPDTAAIPSDDNKDAFIFMTALKPIYPASQVFQISNADKVEAVNQLSRFQYSVPFTQSGKAHAKTIDLQWKKTTILTVSNAFPFMLLRQQVAKREIRKLNPIEVAIDDITERIASMNDELNKKANRDSSDGNNLMRLVQGTVAPQVNAGAAEVAKVFLGRIVGNMTVWPQIEGIEDNAQLQETRTQLKKSRLVLEKARVQLLAPLLAELAERPPLPVRTSQSPNDVAREARVSDVHTHQLTWQTEMDKGYTTLAEAIYPYISDIVSMDELKLV